MKRYRCEECGALLASRARLDKHHRLRHGGESVTLKLSVEDFITVGVVLQSYAKEPPTFEPMDRDQWTRLKAKHPDLFCATYEAYVAQEREGNEQFTRQVDRIARMLDTMLFLSSDDPSVFAEQMKRMGASS